MQITDSHQQPTVFNPIQMHLLKMFEVDNSQAGLAELRDVLYKYYSKKMGDTLDKLWESGELGQKRLDEINQMDLHKLS